MPAVNIPGELPGARTAPETKVAEATVPEPPSLEPEARVTLPIVPLTESRPEFAGSVTLTDGALTPFAILSVPLPCFSRVVLPMPVTTGAVVNTTVLAPRSSLAVEPAATSRLTGVELLASQRSVALLPTARVAPEGKAPVSRPMVAPAPASMRTSFLKRLAAPPRIQVPAPSTARLARGLLPTARLAAKRLTRPAPAESERAGSAPVVAKLEAVVNSSEPVPLDAIVAEPPMVKLRVVTALVLPVNSSVAPEPRTRLAGSVSVETPSELLASSRKAALMTAVSPATEVEPV